MSESHSELAARWQDLTSFVPEGTRHKWWTKIIESYDNRPFRGLDHLSSMLRLFDKHKDCLKDRYATAYAIFFKNIIYDPLSQDNAEKSADLVKQFSQETTFDSANYVADLILSSASSSTDAHLTPGLDGGEDLHYLIDFDMAFLGDDPDKFIEHEKAQRKEYSHLSDEEYKKQREKILKFFLQIPNIYATRELRNELEDRARSNIADEIQALESNQRQYD